MRVVGFPNLALLIAVMAIAVLAASAPAQLSLPGFGGPGGGPVAAPSILITAQFTAPTADGPAEIFVTADIPASHHVYSVDQPPGGPQKTTISLDPSPQYKLAGPFQATTPPETHVDTEVWVGLEIQEHFGPVTWHAPLEIVPGADFKTLTISGTIDTQLCDEGHCIPMQLPFTARLGAGVEVDAAVERPPLSPPAPPAASPPLAGGPPAAAGPAASAARLEGPTFQGRYQAEGGAVTIEGHLRPSVVAPGDKVRIVLTATPEKPWHVYALADRDPKEVSKPTLIVIDRPAGMKVHSAATAAEVVEENQEDVGLGIQRYYRGPVTWQVEVDVPPDMAAGEYTLGGIIGYQVCQATGCKPPTGLRLQAALQVGDQTGSAEVPLVFAEADYGQAARAAADRPIPPPGTGLAEGYDLQETGDEHSLLAMLAFGFLGGLILNLMPCVLPVIGLKLLSFVEQSGKSRSHALTLNIWYSVGILSVFLLLAGLAVGMGMMWGEQFGNDIFNIGLCAFVFAMGLSLLGVWEIPIPGFAGGQRATDLAEQEGPGGALLKGIITTILATPCTGPFMGMALAWAVRQHAATTFAVFGSMGIGMASPYLLIGAFPNLIRWLPKPGGWMVTFKQITGFILLGTVIYLLTFIHPSLVVPTVTLLAGIAAGCWWIARTPGTSAAGAQLMAWIGGIAIAAVAGLFAFGWLADVMTYRFNKSVATAAQITAASDPDELDWQPFSEAKLDELSRQQQTVLVDFTADWCATCKTLERLVLHTKKVKDAIERHRIATLVADYTRRPPAIKQMLERLKSNGVPVVAIFPAGAPQRPIVFRGMYTQSALLEAIEQAVAVPAARSARSGDAVRGSQTPTSLSRG
jgi:suppressor for copper-sensitivity B